MLTVLLAILLVTHILLPEEMNARMAVHTNSDVYMEMLVQNEIVTKN